MLKSVNASSNQVEISTPEGGSETLDYDALIIATGGSYGAIKVDESKSTPNLLKDDSEAFSTWVERRLKFSEAASKI